MWDLSEEVYIYLAENVMILLIPPESALKTYHLNNDVNKLFICFYSCKRFPFGSIKYKIFHR